MSPYKLAWRTALAACLISTSLAVSAQEGEIEEIVVTGSHIKGTPTDAELPVDVINRQDMDEIGSPSVIELVRNLGVTSGNLGETNQFQAGGQANEGVATINLRGLGAARTLVLINGRRHVSTELNGVDINALPISAIGRTEILKDGAAALYGSDAIGGVVNFITREGFEGFEIGGSYQGIQDGGDWDINGLFGTGGERWNWMIAAEYGQRKEIPFKKRDWAVRPFSENSQGGWSGIANPANILWLDGSGVQKDPECENLGGYRDAIDSCGFQFTFFDNLVEKTKQQKYFSEFNYDITPTSTFHIEGLYSFVDIPAWKTSPSYPPQSLFGPDRVVQADHPGLVDLRASYPDVPQTGSAIPINRARGVTGKLPGGTPESSPRETKTYRVAAGLDGTLFDDQLNYDVSVSWSKRQRDIGGHDMFIERMGYALNGFGGPDCDRSVTGGDGTTGVGTPVGTPGVGNCEYYNPFSNAIERSAVTGYVNPNYNPAVANSAEMLDWLIAETDSSTENELLVFDATFSGETGVQLGGGSMGWAVGGQVRRERYDYTVADVVDRALNPCPWHEDPDMAGYLFGFNENCSVPSGQLAFLAAADEEFTSRRVYGLYGELAMPLSDTFNMQLAVRFEDYGGNVGSTIDPKAAFSWNFAEGFTLRGSAGTTFRGPPQSILSGTGTALQFIAAQNAFKAVDVNGNPDLDPEKAVTTNLGLIFQNEVFYGSIDYWYFDFSDSFQTESAQQITSAYFAQGCEDPYTNPTSECDALRSHVFPTGTSAAGLERIDTNWINGSDIKTSGFDVFAQYDFLDVFGGTLGIGLQGTYVIEYKSDDFLDINGITLAEGGDFAGFLNDGDPFTPKPELQGNVFLRYDHGIHNAQLIVRHVSSYDDIRPASSTVNDLTKVDSQTTLDLHYNVQLFDSSTYLSLAVLNATDEDPPPASTDLNYDPFTHNPFGRMFKVGLKYSFNP